MTGTLRVFRDPPPRRAHDHVDIVLDGGTLLRYLWTRCFAPASVHPRALAA
jgi:formamidopyrimidine-DNA glycosylase